MTGNESGELLMILNKLHGRGALVSTLLAAVMLTSACGSEAPDEDTAAAPGEDVDAPSEELADVCGGEPLIVGTDPTHPPHDFLDEDGEIVGWENEFIYAVGEQMGCEIEYQSASFDALLPGLSSNRYDLVFANMGVTAERLEVVDMVTAFAGGQAFLAHADSGLELPDLDALCGVSVGVTRGSVQADLAAEQSEKCTAAGEEPVEVMLFQTGDQIILAVESKRVDSYWTAGPIAQFYSDQPGSVLAVAGDVPGTRGVTAIALPKGSELTEPVHEAVQALIDDGTYMGILEEWGLQDNAIETSEINPPPAG